MLARNQNVLFLSRLSALLVLVVLVLLSATAARSNVRLDLTEEGLYTLSDASRRVLRSLEDPATIRVYWHKVPEDWETDRRYIDSLLREMKSAAGDRLSVRWVDLEDEEEKREAATAGVQPSRFQVVEEGEVRFAEGYNSLVIQIADESEVVDQIASEDERLEYEIVSRLSKMTRVDELVVGLVAPRPAFNPFAGAQSGRFRALEFVLRRQFGTGFRSHVSLDEPVAPDVDVLLVVAPKEVEEKAVYHFEQFLLRGGRAALLLDPVHAPAGQAPNSQAESAGFEEWLEGLGVTLESGVVGDFASYLNRPRMFQTPLGRGYEFIRYPYWVLLTARSMDRGNPATRGFDQIPLYWPAALSVDGPRHAAAGRTVTTLGTTTERGYRRPDLIGLDQGERDPVRVEDLEAHIPVLLLVEGPMTSFWKGRKTPVESAQAEASEGEDGTEPDEGAEPAGADEPGEDADGEEGSEPAEAEKPAETDEPQEEAEGEEGEGGEAEAEAAGEAEEDEPEEEGPPRLDEGTGLLVIAGDAEMVSDDAAQLGRNYAFGFDFLLNLVDWMGGSEDLLTLRSRARKARVIADIEPKEQKLIKWGHMATIPLLSLLAWIVVFIVRRYQR